jgi:hypothetical protein
MRCVLQMPAARSEARRHSGIEMEIRRKAVLAVALTARRRRGQSAALAAHLSSNKPVQT